MRKVNQIFYPICSQVHFIFIYTTYNRWATERQKENIKQTIPKMATLIQGKLK